VRLKLDNEILSIIGNINLKTLQIKNKIGLKDKKNEESELKITKNDSSFNKHDDNPLSLS